MTERTEVIVPATHSWRVARAMRRGEEGLAPPVSRSGAWPSPSEVTRGSTPVEASAGVRLDGVRLALVTDTFLPQVNGVTRTLDRLVRTVGARGGAVEVFTSDDPAATPSAHVQRFPSVAFWGYPELRLAAPGSRRLGEAMRRWGATLVHAATPFGMGLAARRAAQRGGIPLVTSYHTHFTAYAHFYQLGLLSRPGWRFLRWFHNSGARTFCPTATVAAELERHGFERTAVWGRGVDTEIFSPEWRTPRLRSAFGLREHDLVVLYVGRVAREKGIDDAIDAMRLLQALPDAPPCRLLVVGDGPHLAACRARAGETVTFAGHRSGEELSRLYATADVFVFPSTTDTFGNVTLEAMASGLPVVAADSAVTRELMVPGAGSFYTPGDASGLAAHIARWGRDPAMRRAAGRRGREGARARSWDCVFDALFADYLAAVKEGARRS